jgi:fido (protein-threonine AMPylation protein)
VAVRLLLEDAKAWVQYKTDPPDEIAVRFHHHLVQIHPFPKGKPAAGRLCALLRFARS